MKIINGKQISNVIKAQLLNEVKSFPSKPGLAVIQIGNDEASNIYIKNKERLCNDLNINFFHIKFEENVSYVDVKIKIELLNKDENIHGIILQLPIPNTLNSNDLLNLLDPSKDVDGLTNINKINLINNIDGFIPCTPKGILELLNNYDIDVEGKHVVIVGRSDLVGKPLMNILLNKNATVTICHSKTQSLDTITKSADILISIVGQRNLIKKHMVKENSIVIDVGIVRENNNIFGDVDFNNVKEKCSYITPVPGGVGPMTVIMLMKNVIESYKNHLK